jgi:hypothetical protein
MTAISSDPPFSDLCRPHIALSKALEKDLGDLKAIPVKNDEVRHFGIGKTWNRVRAP